MSSDLDFIRVDIDSFAAGPNQSVDYAAMKKNRGHGGFTDGRRLHGFGSWSSLRDVSDEDVSGNAAVSDVMLFDTKNSVVRADEKLVALWVLYNMGVAATRDATRVAYGGRIQDAKVTAPQLKEEGRSE